LGQNPLSYCEQLPLNLNASVNSCCGFYTIYNSLQRLAPQLTIAVLKSICTPLAEYLNMPLKQYWDMYRSTGTGEDLIPAVLEFCGFEISKSIELNLPSNSTLNLSAEEFTSHLNSEIFALFLSYDQLVISVQKHGMLHVVAAFREIRTNEFYIIDNNVPPKRLSTSRLFKAGGAAIKVIPLKLPAALKLQITEDSDNVADLSEVPVFQAYLTKLNDEDIRSSIILATAKNARSNKYRVWDLGICWVDFQDSVECLFISKLINKLFLDSSTENNIELMAGDTFTVSFAFYMDEHEDDNAREVHYLCAVFSLINLVKFVRSTECIQQLKHQFSISVFDPAKAANTEQSSTDYKQQWTHLMNFINRLEPANLFINHPVKPCQYNDKEDSFCQTWTLHYLLQRVEGNSHDQVMQFYNNLTIPLMEFILQIAHQLIEQCNIL
jgi:hypothetical protein